MAHLNSLDISSIREVQQDLLPQQSASCCFNTSWPKRMWLQGLVVSTVFPGIRRCQPGSVTLTTSFSCLDVSCTSPVAGTTCCTSLPPPVLTLFWNGRNIRDGCFGNLSQYFLLQDDKPASAAPFSWLGTKEPSARALLPYFKRKCTVFSNVIGYIYGVLLSSSDLNIKKKRHSDLFQPTVSNKKATIESYMYFFPISKLLI